MRWRRGRGRCGRGSPAPSRRRRSRRPASRRGRSPGRGPRRAGTLDVLGPQLGHVAPALGDERARADRVAELGQAGSPDVAASSARCPARAGSRRGRAGRPGRAGRRRGLRPAAPSARAGPRRRGRGSGASRGTEGRGRAPGRCCPDEVRARRLQPQVGAPEGNDPRVRVGAGRDREPVRPGAGAEDRLGRPRCCLRSGGSTTEAPARPNRSCTSQPVAIAPPAVAQVGGAWRRRRRGSRRRRSPASGGRQMPRAWGSISRSSSGPIRRSPGTAFAGPRRSSSSRRGSSDRSVATITLPSRRASIPRSSQ